MSGSNNSYDFHEGLTHSEVMKNLKTPGYSRFRYKFIKLVGSLTTKDLANKNWQGNVIPQKHAESMTDLLVPYGDPETKKFLVLFSLETLESLVHIHKVPPQNITFMGDAREAVESAKIIYGAKGYLLSKSKCLSGGKISMNKVLQQIDIAAGGYYGLGHAQRSIPAPKKQKRAKRVP